MRTIHIRRKRKAPTLQKRVRKLERNFFQQEVKHYDYAGTLLPDYTGTVITSPYRLIAQGDTDTTRDGDKLTVRTMTLRSSWLLNIGQTTACRCRLIAFIYKNNPDSITTSFATIINLYLQSILTSSQAPLARQDWDNHGAFVTLYDKSRIIPVQGTTVGQKVNWDVSLKIPQKYREVSYSAGSSSITNNELYWVFITDRASTAVDCDYNIRTTFRDA